MKIKNILSIIMIATFCESCFLPHEAKILALFDKTTEVEARRIKLSGSIGKPIQILAHDSLVIINEFRNDYLLNIYDLKSGMLINKLASVGKGPNEFLPPIQVSFINNYEGISIYERSESKFKEYTLTDSMELSFLWARNFSSNHSLIQELDSNAFVSSGPFMSGRFCYVSRTNESERVTGEYPDMEIIVHKSSNDKLDFNIKEMIFQSRLGIRPDGKYMVSCAIQTGVFEIYEIRKDSFIKKKELRDFNFIELDDFSNSRIIKVDFSKNYPRGFSDVYVTQEYVYALYSGRSHQDFPYASHLGSTILVFDWEGNPVHRFDLKENLKCFTLNKSLNQFFAISLSEDNFEVVSYDFNKYLRTSDDGL